MTTKTEPSGNAAEQIDPYPSRTGSEPLVSPRLDPIVWSKADAPCPLTDLQRTNYLTKGFVVLPEVFSEQEVDELKRSVQGSLTGEGIDPQTMITEPSSDMVRSIFEIHRQNDDVGALMRDERLASVARYLLGGDFYMHQTRVNYKPGFDGKEFWWHSDFETWHVEDGMPRMHALSMSVLLDANTEVNGPLMIIGGSHEVYVACVGETPEDHYKGSLRKQEYGVPDEEVMTDLAERGGVHAMLAPAGSVVVFECNCIHGSPGNISPFSRSNLFFVYNSIENAIVAPFGGTKPRPQYIANRKYLEPI